MNKSFRRVDCYLLLLAEVENVIVLTMVFPYHLAVLYAGTYYLRWAQYLKCVSTVHGSKSPDSLTVRTDHLSDKRWFLLLSFKAGYSIGCRLWVLYRCTVVVTSCAFITSDPLPLMFVEGWRRIVEGFGLWVAFGYASELGSDCTASNTWIWSSLNLVQLNQQQRCIDT